MKMESRGRRQINEVAMVNVHLIYSFVNPSKCDKIRRENDVKHKINGNEKAIVYKKCPFHPLIFFKLHLINVNQIKVRSDKCRK